MTLAAAHPMRIQVCGQLAIDRDGERLDGLLPGRQGRLLFIYLIVNRHRYLPRDELAEALWREPDPAAVDARLNPLLSKLRKVFGAGAVAGRSGQGWPAADSPGSAAGERLSLPHAGPGCTGQPGRGARRLRTATH